MCDCGTETETTEHFFLCCPFFVTERRKLLNNVYDKHFSSQSLKEKSMIDIPLYRCDKLNKRDRQLIILNLVNVLKDH